jgi:hypothetical protein
MNELATLIFVSLLKLVDFDLLLFFYNIILFVNKAKKNMIQVYYCVIMVNILN